MPRTRSLAWSELKIGIIAVVAMVLAAMIIVAVGGAGGFFWQRYELKTQVPRREGPEERRGRPRRRRRSGQGHRASRSPAPRSKWCCEVKKGNEQRITSDSRASIGSLSLLGEPVIDISPATTGTPLKDGDYIPAGRAPGTAGGRRRRRARVARADHRRCSRTSGPARARSASCSATTSSTRRSRASSTAAEGVTSHLRDGRGTSAA